VVQEALVEMASVLLLAELAVIGLQLAELAELAGVHSLQTGQMEQIVILQMAELQALPQSAILSRAAAVEAQEMVRVVRVGLEAPEAMARLEAAVVVEVDLRQEPTQESVEMAPMDT
jgi:hypothetical protein